MMQRRELFAVIGGAIVGWPFGSLAQQSAKIPRVGILVPGHAGDASQAAFNAVIQGLQELGYLEGQNIVFERRFGESNPERLRGAAAELVERQVDLIVAQSTTAALPAKQATKQIPIVAVGMADPVADGLVTSLAHPGGNLTGTTFLGPELVGKRLQILREVIPKLSRVAVLWQPHAYSDRTMAGMVKEVESAAQTLGVHLQFVPASNPDEIAGAFSEIVRERATAVILFPSPMLFAEYPRIAQLAADSRLPAIFAAREGAVVGGLMAYGANLPHLFRQTAVYAQKILRGAKPADLPVEQPTKFELVINLKTARNFGFEMPPTMLARADEVIE